MNLSDISSLLKSIGPIVGDALKSGQLLHPSCELSPPHPDILCEYDIPVPMADGTKLTANIFRSQKAEENGEKVPVVMCAHPYDNHKIPALKNTPFGGPPQQYRIIPQGGGKPRFSEITSWESPDPNFWVPAGYAIVNLNLPGYANSEGKPSVFSDHQAQCYYEAIEWIAQQAWCTGKVGLNGVSFLAISQYAVAFTRAFGGPPPSLKCISPWEGLSDMYQDVACVGGVPDNGFLSFWWNTEVKETINGTVDDFIEVEGAIATKLLELHPNYDDYWKSKIPQLEKITLPMLVCASFSDQGLHTMGSFRAFEKVSSPHKWVYTHRTGKWVSYYSEEVQQLTKQFMDCFLKDKTDNGMLEMAPVRLEVRSSKDEIHEVRYENEWPLARTQYTQLFLNAAQGSLETTLAPSPTSHYYDGKGGMMSFHYTFPEDTELSGYLKLKLWVESQAGGASKQIPPDMTIFSGLKKYNTQGQDMRFYGSVGLDSDMVTRGCLRVSRRKLNAEASSLWHPVYDGTTSEFLSAGEIVPIEIALYPQSTFFRKGEMMELIVSAKEIIPSRPYQKSTKGNTGRHVLHIGGDYDSHLLVPLIPSK